ncbi:hypothetical protein IMZ31_23515 (plasmid) [Pontibacillus sp. ALD_SL1]|uniref:DUF6509 family protein n=1 Tax=Pontibacillus sp. ALD_SL1 TaxID=2777185 RepID=UPI001A976583|nr:DUF6509 family protein [Pontibacillus sp. ALD_SL1]QST02421.1 hypothetical protein IMZ31_23515 [Pontibacillus sp. ALD_SL1]
MLTITGVIAARELDYPFDGEKRKRIEAELTIDVPGGDSLQTPSGTVIQVEHIKGEKELRGYRFFEKGTDRKIRYGLKPGEERVVIDYIEDEVVPYYVF